MKVKEEDIGYGRWLGGAVFSIFPFLNLVVLKVYLKNEFGFTTILDSINSRWAGLIMLMSVNFFVHFLIVKRDDFMTRYKKKDPLKGWLIFLYIIISILTLAF
ncbi:hypothetical protein V6R21_01930 [Limibacter armeniacum]|uniref:hypothetical protein n=1 Tax=Limibacter armeniacum TaxID=466084 RepID=UPI002FE639A2